MKDPVPDAMMIWPFRDHLTQANATKKLFGRLDKVLTSKGYVAMSGQTLGAIIIRAPKQRNSCDKMRAIKEGLGGRSLSFEEEPTRTI